MSAGAWIGAARVYARADLRMAVRECLFSFDPGPAWGPAYWWRGLFIHRPELSSYERDTPQLRRVRQYLAVRRWRGLQAAGVNWPEPRAVLWRAWCADRAARREAAERAAARAAERAAAPPRPLNWDPWVRTGPGAGYLDPSVERWVRD